jgi:hypothetical protein
LGSPLDFISYAKQNGLITTQEGEVLVLVLIKFKAWQQPSSRQEP